MRAVALILVFLAGVALVAAGIVRFIQIGRAEKQIPGRRWIGWVWAAMALLTAGLIASIVDGRHVGFTYGVLGAWSAAASALFLTRYLSGPSVSLLALPAGAVALLVVPVWGTGQMQRGGQAGVDTIEGGWITWFHVVFMSSHMAAVLIAAACAAMWLMTSRKLKQASAVALALPSLPRIEMLIERGLVVAAALLTGGLATGGAAASRAGGFEIWHTTPLLGIIAMLVLMAVLGAHAAGGLSKRTLSWAALGLLVVTVGSIISLLVSDPHGR